MPIVTGINGIAFRVETFEAPAGRRSIRSINRAGLLIVAPVAKAHQPIERGEGIAARLHRLDVIDGPSEHNLPTQLAGKAQWIMGELSEAQSPPGRGVVGPVSHGGPPVPAGAALPLSRSCPHGIAPGGETMG
jgi:hypothetical protein